MKPDRICHSREGGNPWPDLPEKIVRAKMLRRQGVALRLSILARTKTSLELIGQIMDSRLRGNDKVCKVGIAL